MASMVSRRLPTAFAAAEATGPPPYSGIPTESEWQRAQKIPAIRNIPENIPRRLPAALFCRSEISVEKAVMVARVGGETAPETLQNPLYSAVCAQADYIGENGGISALSESNSGGSVSLGKFSYSAGGGGSEGGGSLLALCPQAVSLLECTGLLYKGVSVL